VRGCDPQPGAYASLGDKRVRLYDAAFDAKPAGGAPGTIVAIDGSGMRIAVAGATLVVKRTRIDPSPKKVAPNELAATGELKIGGRLA
jgi:methionyl-tRNA formyltransferase